MVSQLCVFPAELLGHLVYLQPDYVVHAIQPTASRCGVEGHVTVIGACVLSISQQQAIVGRL